MWVRGRTVGPVLDRCEAVADCSFDLPKVRKTAAFRIVRGGRLASQQERRPISAVPATASRLTKIDDMQLTYALCLQLDGGLPEPHLLDRRPNAKTGAACERRTCR